MSLGCGTPYAMENFRLGYFNKALFDIDETTFGFVKEVTIRKEIVIYRLRQDY
jgi:hypothetical protein